MPTGALGACTHVRWKLRSSPACVKNKSAFILLYHLSNRSSSCLSAGYSRLPTVGARVTMAPIGTASHFDQGALARRQALTGGSGPAALIKNIRVFSIACFACLGGLLYGYNQGVFSGVLTMNNFGKRKLRRMLPLLAWQLRVTRYGRLGVRQDEARLADCHPRVGCLGRNIV